MGNEEVGGTVTINSIDDGLLDVISSSADPMLRRRTPAAAPGEAAMVAWIESTTGAWTEWKGSERVAGARLPWAPEPPAV